MTRTEIAQGLIEIYEAKNKDYGNSAHQTFCEFGEVALVIRISDKLSRFQSLLTSDGQCVNDESVLDTLGDAVTYLAMLIAEIDTWDNMLSDADNMARNNNIPETKHTLARIGRDADAYPFVPVDAGEAGRYRARLLEIWHGVADEQTRIVNYKELAQHLIEEYRCRA